MFEHDIEQFEDQGRTLYRCSKCGRVQTSADAVELFRCSPTEIEDVEIEE